MEELCFEWDEEKNRRNATKHGISFEQARFAFYDEHARFKSDPDHSGTEDRFILMGLDEQLRLLVVCHCLREKGRVIRLISARKATRPEARYYRRPR